MMTEGERKKRMELDEKVNVLVAELERRGEEVSVRPKNRVERGRSGNGLEQVRLNNVRTKNKEGTGKQGE